METGNPKPETLLGAAFAEPALHNPPPTPRSCRDREDLYSTVALSQGPHPTASIGLFSA